MPDPKPAVSRACADLGKHHRCLGAVYIYPPRGGQRIVACECPVPNCGHGTEVEKSRVRKNDRRRHAARVAS